MRHLLLAITLFTSTLGFSCPSGQFEQCVLPNPFGGCSQKVCVPNGGSVTGVLTGPLSDLNKGVINLGNGVINAPKSVSSRMNLSAASINWEQFEKIDWAAATFIASAIVNGVACVASEGSAPGAGAGGTSVVCSENACACAVLSVVAAIKLRSDMTPEEKQQTEEVINDPKFAEIMSRPETQTAVNSQLNSMGIYQTPRFSNGITGSPRGDKPTFVPGTNNQ